MKKNVSMEMVVGGSVKSLLLVEAGKNWYEIHTYLEMILDDREDLEFTVVPMEGSGKTRFCMKLPGLPKRPNKTIRIGLTIYYESEELCVVRAEELGFGGLYPSTGMVWTEKVSW